MCFGPFFLFYQMALDLTGGGLFKLAVSQLQGLHLLEGGELFVDLGDLA